MNQLSSIKQRAKAPTPVFFKKLRVIGLVLAAVSTALAKVPVGLPVIVTSVAGYMAVGAAVLSAVSQTTVEDAYKHQEVMDE